ncbi:protease modulator HflK [Planctomycetota bacterium]
MKDTENQINDTNGFDAAGKSLSEALKIWFVILKVIMIALVLLYLVSGFHTIDPDERGIVLRFGKIKGVGEERILKPGLIGPLPWLHGVLPYPIDEVVKIPVGKNVNLAVNAFWYYESASDMLPESPARPRIQPTLDPLIDGYCITRSSSLAEYGQSDGSGGSDYNIVHCKWQLIYKIDNPELFFKNVSVDVTKPGQKYFDVITRGIKPFLEFLVRDTVVTTMVNYTIDEVLFSGQESITNEVKALLQAKLDSVKSGIKVQSVQIDDKAWPRQVDAAFQASIQASQIRQTAVSEAMGYAENTLSKTAGLVAEELLDVIRANKTITKKEEEELLWRQVAGQAEQVLAEARAYRTKVVEEAKASAEYLKSILPEYRKRPRLVLQNIYQDAIREVLDNADEKIILQPTRDAENVEIRILINRDPTLKPKSQEEE